MKYVFPIIANYVDFLTVRDMLTLSKDINEEIMNKWRNKELGPFTLYPYQVMLADLAEKVFKTKDICKISAPMGTGKTVTAIYFAINQYKDKNIIICVPPGTVKIWISEFIKINLLHAKPEQSTVLVYHSTRPNHQKYHNMQDNVFETHRIILTSDNLLTKIRGTPDLIIRDETHKKDKKDMRAYSENADENNITYKVLGLTAEDVEPGESYTVLKLISNNFNDKIPKIKFNYYCIDRDSTSGYMKYGKHIDEMYENSEEYRELLINCIGNNTKNVMFLDKGGMGNEIRAWIEEDLSDYKTFELLSSDKTVQSFHTYKRKSILFVGSKNNEGLNIFEENLILFKPDIMGATRIKQSIGRLRRPGNPYETVNCDFIVGNRIGLLKCFYAACYSNQDWNFGFSDAPNEDFLLKCQGFIGALGYENFLDFPLVDGCVIFDNVHTRARHDLVANWWLTYKTSDSVLNLNIINALYI